MRQDNYNWKLLEESFLRYHSMIYKIAYSYTENREDAEDVLQDVFLKFAKQEFFRDENHIKAWLIRVTVNQSINLIKSSYKKKTLPLEDKQRTLAAKPESFENLSEMQTIIMQLPLKYRAALYLYYYEGYKVEEIAELLGKRKAGVYTLINRGREKLKQLLEEGRIKDE